MVVETKDIERSGFSAHNSSHYKKASFSGAIGRSALKRYKASLPVCGPGGPEIASGQHSIRRTKVKGKSVHRAIEKDSLIRRIRTDGMKSHLQSLHACRSKFYRRELRRCRRRRLYLSSGLACLPLLLFLSGNKLLGSDKPKAKRQNERIRTIVGRFRSDLAIPAEVLISIVPQNKRLVSVERSKERRNAFVLSLDRNFLDTLDDSELTAAIAHELGHVWIFTHHPYLQTELLANQIAMKVVTRESLEKVYQRVWKDKGTKGDIEEFLPALRQNHETQALK